MKALGPIVLVTWPVPVETELGVVAEARNGGVHGAGGVVHLDQNPHRIRLTPRISLNGDVVGPQFRAQARVSRSRASELTLAPTRRRISSSDEVLSL